MARRIQRTEPLPAVGLPRPRALIALDIERSTSPPDPSPPRTIDNPTGSRTYRNLPSQIDNPEQNQ